MSRSQLAEKLADLVGRDVLHLEGGNGWPTDAVVEVADDRIPVSLFVGPIGGGGREDRNALERRFQNPGKDRPIELDADRVPLLLGLWTEDKFVNVPHPVLVAADARQREGIPTRHSVFPNLNALETAAETGWFEREHENGEVLVYFHPAYLPGLAGSMAATGAPPTDAPNIILLTPNTGPVDRSRVISTRLARYPKFRQQLQDLYANSCAICGLGLGVTEAAHILPVAASGPDDPRNGVLLCANHHRAFDSHLIWIDPDSHEVRFNLKHPEADRESNAAFVLSSTGALTKTSDVGLKPAREFLVARYEHYKEQYEWADQTV